MFFLLGNTAVCVCSADCCDWGGMWSLQGRGDEWERCHESGPAAFCCPHAACSRVILQAPHVRRSGVERESGRLFLATRHKLNNLGVRGRQDVNVPHLHNQGVKAYEEMLMSHMQPCGSVIAEETRPRHQIQGFSPECVSECLYL